MILASGFSLFTGPSKFSPSKVCSGRCVTRHIPPTYKGDWRNERSIFLPFAPPTLSPAGDTDRKLSFGSMGLKRSPQRSSIPTATPWQVQWALPAEHTMNPPTLPHFSCQQAGPSPLVSRPDSSLTSQLPLSLLHNPGPMQQPERSSKSINQTMSCPYLKSFKGFLLVKA